ncbi:hypothetical protein IRY61_04095 [Candidatus Saccharibacteria bacterium]|nr:hypothetical protein [Candidatus Saccharibacteria bacterium]
MMNQGRWSYWMFTLPRLFGDDVPHVHCHVMPSYRGGDTSERMHPKSGRMQEPVDREKLEDIRWQLLFPAELRDYVDLELKVMGANPLKRFMLTLFNARRLYQGRKAFA